MSKDAFEPQSRCIAHGDEFDGLSKCYRDLVFDPTSLSAQWFSVQLNHNCLPVSSAMALVYFLSKLTIISDLQPDGIGRTCPRIRGLMSS